MPYVIRHPARIDLFFGGREWGPLRFAKIYCDGDFLTMENDEADLIADLEPGDVVMPRPDTQPIHPISPTP